jgi:hypothetical protein
LLKQQTEKNFEGYIFFSLIYRIKLIASKKPVILEYVAAEAIAGTNFSIPCGSFLSNKLDFIASGIDAKLISE